MTEETPPPGIRLSDAEREQAAQRLQRAMSEGRITMAEFEERTSIVYAARFASDLTPVFADLPPQAGTWAAPGADATAIGPLTPAPAPGHQLNQLRPGGVGGLDYTKVAFPPNPVVIDAGWSTVRRKGRWIVPGWLQLRTGPGTIVLDCREATFAQQIIAIDVEVGMGTVKIIVPEGVTADVNAVKIGLGSANSRVPGIPDAQHPHFVCAGKVGAGELVVRNPYF